MRDQSLLGTSSRTSHGGGSLMTAAEHWIQSAGDTCRLVFWPLLHKDVCVYQLARVPPLRFFSTQKKIGLQYKFLLSFPPPWRLWHWQGVQSAENLKTQTGILALCTTGYWEVSQHKLLWILCRIVAKILTLSWIWVGSGGRILTALFFFFQGHKMILHIHMSTWSSLISLCKSFA